MKKSRLEVGVLLYTQDYLAMNEYFIEVFLTSGFIFFKNIIIYEYKLTKSFVIKFYEC